MKGLACLPLPESWRRNVSSAGPNAGRAGFLDLRRQFPERPSQRIAHPPEEEQTPRNPSSRRLSRESGRLALPVDDLFRSLSTRTPLALNLGHWAAAAIAVAKFFATAQNLAPRAAKLPLLKRYKDL